MTPLTNILTNTANGKDYKLFFFSELLDRNICETRRTFVFGKLSDIVFNLSEPYPIAAGLYIDHGWGKPSEFIPWERVTKIEKDTIFVLPPENGEQYPPFVDQPKWILLNEHLMGKTILDMDGRRIELVNDVHLLESKGHMILVHVDISFNGFLRKWHMGWLHLTSDRLISWKYVQPLSLEDTAAKDKVSLSVTRNQIQDLPSEDLADALEELSGEQQQAMFSALDTEKAADTLLEAEPRAQRQIVANLKTEHARAILSEMSVAQLADLFSVLPFDDRNELMRLLSEEQAQRINAILSEHEAKAGTLMSSDYVAMTASTKVGEAMQQLRSSDVKHDMISYIYIVNPPENTLIGVVDLRELVMTGENILLSALMVAPVIAAEETDVKDSLVQLFMKYHFRMIPVTDSKDHLLGVIHHNDIMKGILTKIRI
jgi:magnesium transporter